MALAAMDLLVENAGSIRRRDIETYMPVQRYWVWPLRAVGKVPLDAG